MPNYPALKEQDPSEPLDLGNLQFPIKTEISSAFSNAYEHYQFNTIANNLSKLKPEPSMPASYPVNNDDIKNLKLDRPGLDIPIGVPKYIGSMMAAMYDNDKNYSLVKQHPASIFGRIGAIGASIAGSSLDIKSLFAGGAVGKAGEMAAASIAEKAIGSFGARELYGSGAARVGSLMAQTAGQGAGFGIGSQTETELAEQEKNTNLDQPHDYIQSLQNIGEAGFFGAALGLGGKTIGLGLLGRKVTRLPDGSIMEHGAETGIPESGLKADGTPFVEGGEVTRQGGLLNRPEFTQIPQITKEYIGKVYKPWSKDSDITMKEEGTGQMLNGQMPDVSVVMKQGMSDEGANFRDAMRNGDVDVEALDKSLADAQENITSELFTEHFAEKFNSVPTEALKPREGEVNYYKGVSKTSSEGLSPDRVNDEVFGRGHWMTKDRGVAEQTGKNVETVTGKFNLLDINKIDDKEISDAFSNLKKTANQVKQKSELRDARQNFINMAKEKGYEGIERQSTEGQHEVMFFDKPKSQEALQREARQAKINNLNQQYMLAQSMREHINGTHEPLTQEEVQAYGDHLQSPGIPDNSYKTESPKQDFTVDDYLAEFPEQQIDQLADVFGKNNEMVREIEATREKLRKQNVFAEMTQNLTDCLLKGSVNG